MQSMMIRYAFFVYANLDSHRDVLRCVRFYMFSTYLSAKAAGCRDGGKEEARQAEE